AAERRRLCCHAERGNKGPKTKTSMTPSTDHRRRSLNIHRQKVVDPIFLDAWKRSWGRPPLVILWGNWLFFGPFGLIFIGGTVVFVSSWQPGGGIGAFCLLIAICSGFLLVAWWNYRRLWRITRYYQSFGWSRAAKQVFDARLRDTIVSRELTY